jgi:hypothetical protein
MDKAGHNIMAPAYYLIDMCLLSLSAAAFVHVKDEGQLE